MSTLSTAARFDRAIGQAGPVPRNVIRTLHRVHAAAIGYRSVGSSHRWEFADGSELVVHPDGTRSRCEPVHTTDNPAPEFARLMGRILSGQGD